MLPNNQPELQLAIFELKSAPYGEKYDLTNSGCFLKPILILIDLKGHVLLSVYHEEPFPQDSH